MTGNFVLYIRNKVSKYGLARNAVQQYVYTIISAFAKIICLPGTFAETEFGQGSSFSLFVDCA